MITITDKTLRELNVIDAIFKSQFKKQSEINGPFDWPALSTKDGKGEIDGYYLFSFDIYSDEELFDVQAFKHEITKRYEDAKNPDLLKKHLKQIHSKARLVRDFYNSKLTKPSQDDRKSEENHRGVIEVSGLYVQTIFFGCDQLTFNTKLLMPGEQSFLYHLNNFVLARICQNFIDFINELAVIDAEDDNKSPLASGPVLALLLALSAPETTGEQSVSDWLAQLGYGRAKAGSVYRKFRSIMSYDQEEKMSASIEHLEKLKQLVSDAHPQFIKHVAQIDAYLKKAKTSAKTAMQKKV